MLEVRLITELLHPSNIVHRHRHKSRRAMYRLRSHYVIAVVLWFRESSILCILMFIYQSGSSLDICLIKERKKKALEDIAWLEAELSEDCRFWKNWHNCQSNKFIDTEFATMACVAKPSFILYCRNIDLIYIYVCWPGWVWKLHNLVSEMFFFFKSSEC